jgi:hypothetical protein
MRTTPSLYLRINGVDVVGWNRRQSTVVFSDRLAPYISRMIDPGLLDDTSDDARTIMRRLYGAMTAAEKLKRMNDLTLAASRLSLAGLGLRHPGESEADLLLRLARVRLGKDLSDRVYGPQP